MSERLGRTRGDACIKGRTKVLPEVYGADLLSGSERMCESVREDASEGRSDVAEANGRRLKRG